MRNLKTIIDIDGKEQLKKDCILYKSNYYHINHPNVYFIKDLNKYFHIASINKNNSIKLMMTDYDKVNKKFTFVYNKIDKTKNEKFYFLSLDNIKAYIKGINMELYSNYHYVVEDINKILYDSDFIFNKEIGSFVFIGNLEESNNKDLLEHIKNSFKNSTAVDRAYNIEDNSDYLESIALYNQSNIEIEKDIKVLRPYLKNYTFGIELESSEGSVYPSTLKKYGFSICRDGSISNDEYVSVPMSSLKGLQSIKKFMNINAANVKTDHNCSLHVHIGNIRTDKVFINALYNFLYYFQNDYFNYFPYYKKENVLNKRKHYTKSLPDLCQNIIIDNNKEQFSSLINYNNKNIFLFLTDGFPPCNEFNKKNKRHPFKNKWDRLNRYYVFNFMNLLFSNRGTIEFRIHENTWNSNRVINQILISIAILEFVNNHISECLSGKSFTLNNVINYYFKGETRLNLLEYYKKRKILFESSKGSSFSQYTSNHYDNV